MLASEIYNNLTKNQIKLVDTIMSKYTSDWNTNKQAFRLGVIATLKELNYEV